jgi:hypothetical protein
MKKMIILMFCLICNSVYAKQELLPGLWKISFKIKTENKVIEPSKQIRETLAKLDKREREHMVLKLKNEAGIDEYGRIKICYTPESFDLEESTISEMGNSCISKIVKSTNSKVISNFICEDGMRGINTWFIKNSRSYTGVTKVVSPWGEESEIIYEGKYFAPLCEAPDEKVVI